MTETNVAVLVQALVVGSAVTQQPRHLPDDV
jgi:hypothetical protein